LATQDPEIATGPLADDRPAVILRVIEHPIIAVERTEEADLQFCIGRPIDHFGAASGIAQLSAGLPTPVEDVDAAVCPQRIVRRDALAAFLETLFVTGNLIPATEVLL